MSTVTLHDDAQVIRDIIAAAKANGETTAIIPKSNPITGAEIYNIASTVWLDSDTTVILDGCTLRFADDVTCNMFASIGAWDTRDSEAVNKGYKNIKILGKNGAKFEGGNSNGQTEKTIEDASKMFFNSFILLRNVEGFEISGIECVEPRFWCFTNIAARYGSIHDIHFDCHNKMPNQDGIDLRAGCNNIDIYNITGATGDDTVALTTIGRLDEWWTVDSYSDIDIHDVTMKDINAGCSGGHGVIRLLAHDTRKIYNVDMVNIRDASVDGVGIPSYACIRIGDVRYFAEIPQEMGDLTGVRIDGVISNSQTAILVNNDNITKNDVSYTNVTAIQGEIITVKDSEKFFA